MTIAGAGVVVLLIGSGTYASARQQAADRKIVFLMEETSGDTDTDNAGSSVPGDIGLSAGAGVVLDENMTELSVEAVQDEDGTGSSAETASDEETAADDARDDEDIRLSAGAGTVLDASVIDIEDLVAAAEATAETVSALSEPETHWGYTNLGIAHVDNHLNIRQEPSENGKLIGKLSKDAACEILETDNGWAHIKSGKVEGYCSTDYLYMGEEAIARGHEVASMIAIVNTQTLKVREEPNTECVVITLIPEGEELEVVEIMENGWVKFLLDDEEAYVSGDYVDVEERLEKAVTLTELLYGQGVSNVRVDLVQYAKQFVGNPYVWGGASLTNGADCSGFTMSIYKKYGISLPHHAASQAQLGTKISAAEAQPGDLVFYAKNGVINHVAIYIGNGQVIHASSPKTGIKISSMNYRTVACIRRYL